MISRKLSSLILVLQSLQFKPKAQTQMLHFTVYTAHIPEPLVDLEICLLFFFLCV